MHVFDANVNQGCDPTFRNLRDFWIPNSKYTSKLMTRYF